MIRRKATSLLMRPEGIAPSADDWEVVGTFNPGVARLADEVVLLVRVAERPREQRSGWTPLPRWSAEDSCLAVDWFRDEDLDKSDPRVARLRSDGSIRLTNVSHLRIAFSRDGRTIDRVEPQAIMPQSQCEEFGIEDPRITQLEDQYFITYVAVSRHGPATALASTRDFKTFEHHGIIFCPENKDVVLFPERIGGDYVALHRPVCGTPFSAPQMWLARSIDLTHWGKHEHMFGGASAWESGRVGAGAPPIAISGGWLEIYHGTTKPNKPGEVGTYCGGAMVLARDEPGRILGVGKEPIIRPELPFESEGFVANVVFPTGLLAEDNLLLIYYGASDKYSAVMEASARDILEMCR